MVLVGIGIGLHFILLVFPSLHVHSTCAKTDDNASDVEFLSKKM
jgi:hypothetical protein